VNPPFVIPANTVKTFYEQSEVFTQPKSLLALQPHCHLIGKSWKVYMVTAPGDTTNLISIPNWSFDWQMCYFLTQVIEIPVGAQLFAEAVFDNTSNNPNNPSNPPKPVVAGETSFHEMMSVRFWVLDYQPGDEDIVLDSSYFTGSVATSLKNALPLKISPNPASDKIYFVASLPEHEISWELINSFGQIVKTGRKIAIPKGMYTEEINASELSSGSYFLSVASGDKQVTEKVVIVR
jgi:hypothetical protein